MSRLLIRVLAILVGAAILPCLSQAQQIDLPNAQVLNEPVNCRDEAPHFSISTLINLRLKLGKVVEIIAANSRLRIDGKKVYSTGDLWYFVKSPEGRSCWVYGGEEERPINVKLDNPGLLVPLVAFESSHIAFKDYEDLASLGIASAHAANKKPDNVAVERVPDKLVFPVLVVWAFQAAVFVVSLGCMKKWVFQKNDTLVFLSSFSVLAILNVIGESQLTELIEIVVRITKKI